MRFRLGPVPDVEGFGPGAEGWTRLREPDPWKLQVLALPLAAALGGLTWGAILVLTPVDLQPSSYPLLALSLVVVIPAHELIHAALHPGLGGSPHTVIGFWPAKLLFYAHYTGPIRRARFLSILAAPFAALTVGPVLAAAVLRLDWWILGDVALFNALAAYGDAAAVLIVALQVPRDATVRNRGYWTYWKIPGQDGLKEEPPRRHRGGDTGEDSCEKGNDRSTPPDAGRDGLQ